MNTGMTQLDWCIIAVYLLAVVGLGVAAGFLRPKGDGRKGRITRA